MLRYKFSKIDKSSESKVLFLGPVDVQKAFFSEVKRPKSLPNRQMIYDPIFSTWAIFKKSIDDAVLREHFENIKKNGYRPSNFEIDDGYEGMA